MRPNQSANDAGRVHESGNIVLVVHSGSCEALEPESVTGRIVGNAEVILKPLSIRLTVQKRASGKWKIFPGQVLVSENPDPHPSSQLHPSSRLSHLLLAVGYG